MNLVSMYLVSGMKTGHDMFPINFMTMYYLVYILTLAVVIKNYRNTEGSTLNPLWES
jgi:hypothetical protein